MDATIRIGLVLGCLAMISGCEEEPIRQTAVVVDRAEASKYNIPDGVVEAELAEMAARQEQIAARMAEESAGIEPDAAEPESAAESAGGDIVESAEDVQ